MTLQDVLDAIVANCPLVKKSGFLTDLTDINAPPEDTPAVFVFWGETTAAGNDGAGSLVTQAVQTAISILIVVPVPGETGDALIDVQDELFAALVGLEVGNRQLTYAGGIVDSIDAGLIRWRDNYQFTRYVRAVR